MKYHRWNSTQYFAWKVVNSTSKKRKNTSVQSNVTSCNLSLSMPVLNEWWRLSPYGRKCQYCIHNDSCTRNRMGKHLDCWERILTSEEIARKNSEINDYNVKLHTYDLLLKEKQEKDRVFANRVLIVFGIIVCVVIIIICISISNYNAEQDRQRQEYRSYKQSTLLPDKSNNIDDNANIYTTSVLEYFPNFESMFSANLGDTLNNYRYSFSYFDDEKRFHVKINYKLMSGIDFSKATDTLAKSAPFDSFAENVASFLFDVAKRNNIKVWVSVAMSGNNNTGGWSSYRWDFNQQRTYDFKNNPKD